MTKKTKPGAAKSNWPGDAKPWPLSKIKEYEKNPRTHPPEQIKLLAQMLLKWGPDQPIVVDENGVILKGHGRKLAAKLAAFEEFPVVQRFGLADDQKQAIRIADNQISLLSNWNPALLRVEIGELKLANFDMALLGFSDEALKTFSLDPVDAVAQALGSLATRFGIVPFSVLNAREGVWQERKRAWLALGIQSEVGRGENLLGRSPQELFCHFTGIQYGEARKIVTEAMERLGDKFDIGELIQQHGGKVNAADFSKVRMSPTIQRLKPSADQALKRSQQREASGG